METIKIYTVIPYFSNGIEVFLNEVKSFTSFDFARDHGYKYTKEHGGYFDIAESEVELNLKNC